VRVLIGQGLSWQKIAEATKITRQALYNWRTQGSDSFNEDFAQMVEDAQEEYTSGKTKAGQMVQSVKHILKKTLWEYRTVDVRSLDKKEKKKAKVRSLEKEEERTMVEMSPPPEMPPSWLTKDYLIDYAEQVLDLELDPRATINDMRAECLLRVKELTVTVKVKIENDQEVDPSQAAVKNVLTNTGKEDRRWSFKEEHDVPKDGVLAGILARIGQKKNPLPRDEDV